MKFTGNEDGKLAAMMTKENLGYRYGLFRKNHEQNKKSS